MPKTPPLGHEPISREESLVRLLVKSQRRRAVPFRKTLVQRGLRTAPQPGALATFVTNRDMRALDLYLLHRALATKEPYDTRVEAGAWARMVGLEPVKGVAVVSRAWGRLVKMKLVSRRRGGRLAVITSLQEDGQGREYTRPSGKHGDTYLQVPLSYWLDGYDKSLSLRAKAMLLICLSLQEWSPLPAEQVPSWYGISADTAERGLDELGKAGIVLRRVTWRREPLLAYGFIKVYEYAVSAKFTRARRLIAAVQGGATSTESKAG